VRLAWKDVAVPKPSPREFRDDVVRVTRDRDPGVTVEQIAKDFGVHPMTLFEWLRRAAAYLSQASLPGKALPARERAGRCWDSRGGDVPVLKIARQPYYRWLVRSVTDAELEQAYRANALFDAHRDDPEFGYRFLADEARDAGEPMAPTTDADAKPRSAD
jgi:hypothetical protein